MIRQLNWGLLAAMIVVIVVIGIAFRSFKVLLLSVLPNLFPIVAAGTLLNLTGGGLEYASVIALTVGFGIAVVIGFGFAIGVGFAIGIGVAIGIGIGVGVAIGVGIAIGRGNKLRLRGGCPHERRP